MTMLIVMPGNCPAGELSVEDFTFDGPLRSEGARIEKLGVNHFKVILGGAPKHSSWPNKLNCQITRNAKGHALRLDVTSPGGNKYAFNEYFQSYLYDGKTWHQEQRS